MIRRLYILDFDCILKLSDTGFFFIQLFHYLCFNLLAYVKHIAVFFKIAL